MSDTDPAQDPPTVPIEAPVDPLFTHPASPFLRTETPTPVAFEGPRNIQAQPAIYSTWVTYRAQIEFGLAMFAYLAVLVGSVTVVGANPTAPWRYYVIVLPVLPGALVIWQFVMALARLDEMQKRIQMEAFGFALATTALLTFGYGFLEGAGLPHLSWTFVLPLMAVLWAIGAAICTWRYR
ncbi:MAG: hypothetical protein ABI455_11150 [Candidatus Dormiibacterota bacterium]